MAASFCIQLTICAIIYYDLGCQVVAEKRKVCQYREMVLYETVAKEACVQQEINRSRFIGHICPVESREEAEMYIASIREQYKDATHNVPAMVIGQGQQIQWGSDDGEPQGTSGAPIVQMLTKRGLTNVVVVVTRYFGGIKLGPGGLIRAYTGCVAAAVEAAGIRQVRSLYELVVELEYSLLPKLQNIAENSFFQIGNLEYTDCVTCSLLCEKEDKEHLKRVISDLARGGEKILKETAKNA